MKNTFVNDCVGRVSANPVRQQLVMGWTVQCLIHWDTLNNIF